MIPDKYIGHAVYLSIQCLTINLTSVRLPTSLLNKQSEFKKFWGWKLGVGGPVLKVQSYYTNIPVPQCVHIEQRPFMSLSLRRRFTPCRHLKPFQGENIQSYNLFSLVMMTIWWMKLGGNLPLGHDALLFPIRGTGSFIYAQSHRHGCSSEGWGWGSQSSLAQGRFVPPTCRSTVEHANHQTTWPSQVWGSIIPRVLKGGGLLPIGWGGGSSAKATQPRVGHPLGAYIFRENSRLPRITQKEYSIHGLLVRHLPRSPGLTLNRLRSEMVEWGRLTNTLVHLRPCTMHTVSIMRSYCVAAPITTSRCIPSST